MIRLATKNDIKQILNITRECSIIMNEKNDIRQWDDGYPNYDTFLNDVLQKNLHVYVIDESIAGFIVLNKQQYDEYDQIIWSNTSTDFLVIHRFATNPKFQNMNIATSLINHCFIISRKNNINYIKIDTNSKNKAMNNLIKKNGFKFKGSMKLKDDPYYPLWNCYDIIF